jgi:hypothetical protein
MPLVPQNLRFYLLLASLVLIGGIVVILGFSYWRLQRLFTASTAPQSAESRRLSQLAWTEVDRLKAEQATMPARPKQPPDNCLQVPLEQDVKTGIYKWGPVMLTGNQTRQGYYNFHYSARLDGFTEKTINGCDYYQLTFFKNGDFIINIPKGIMPVGAFSRVNPTFMDLHLGRNFQLRIQYYSPNGEKDFSSLKFIDWEIESLKVN